jgi:hypothetical protein
MENDGVSYLPAPCYDHEGPGVPAADRGFGDGYLDSRFGYRLSS